MNHFTIFFKCCCKPAFYQFCTTRAGLVTRMGCSIIRVLFTFWNHYICAWIFCENTMKSHFLDTAVLPEQSSLSYETIGSLVLMHSLEIILTHTAFTNKQRHSIIFTMVNWPQFQFLILFRGVCPVISSQICQFHMAWIESSCLSIE